MVGRKGYRAATVGDAIVEARASRATFYKYFDDKHDCFLAATDIVEERVLAAIEASCHLERPWRERVRDGLDSLVELLAADPELARTALIEMAAAGAEVRGRQLATLARIGRLLEAGRGHTDTELPVGTGLMAVGAVAGLLRDEIQADRCEELRSRLPELLFALLVPYLGPQPAAEEMRARS